jgi:hypothetical protein
MKSLMTTMTNRALPAALAISLFLVAAACTRGTPERAAAPQKAENPPAPAATDAGTSSGTGESPAALQSQTARERIVGKWTGDLDGMIQRRVIRVLTTYSKTNYFVDQGIQRGLV